MIALQTKLQSLRDALVAVFPETYHYQRPARKAAPFAVWKEDHEDLSIEADNHKAEQGISGYLDYFTLTEFDSTVDAFQTCLNETAAVKYWDLDSVDKEDETGLIHYRWSWRV
jgi:hypothetical protein